MANMTSTPAMLHILLALAKGDLNPPAIAHLIAVDSQSTLLINESTMYKALKRLAESKYIEISLSSSRAYTLTPRGRRTLQSERIRYQRVASLMAERLS
jgi:DNA-binding PadR family transcriptional regulator